MASVYFASLDDAEAIELDFLRLDGSARRLKMLVDTGFTGKSSVILGPDANDLIRAVLPATQTSGALHGPRDRAWVTCRISPLAFESTIIAILADLSGLALPAGTDGMVGLTFLRQFARWGAACGPNGWLFFLSTDS
jgi:hypothetical protein